MLRLVGLVVSIGLADSINPTTVGPALFLAGGERGRRRVAEFTCAVFAVNLLGGAAIALGPGQIVLLVLFNACFVLPLVGIIVMLFVGDSAASVLSRARDRVQAHWPAVLAGTAFLAGVLVVTVGVAGLSGHARFGQFI
jgi:hypothetical protein